MADELVTLGTFHNVVEAQFAVNRLKAAGVPAYLADENIVGMDFLLGNAIGWIKVQVAETDVGRAEAALADPADPVAEGEIPWDDAALAGAADAAERAEVERAIAEQQGVAPPEYPADYDERLVTTGYRLAVFGLFFFPLIPISLVFVLTAAFQVKDMSPAAKRRFHLALLIDLGWPAVVGLLVCGCLGSAFF